MSEDKVLVKFYAGDYKETVDMLEILHVDLDEWESWFQQEQDNAIDKEFESWMWGFGILGWERL
jgi:hypothetical protein